MKFTPSSREIVSSMVVAPMGAMGGGRRDLLRDGSGQHIVQLRLALRHLHLRVRPGEVQDRDARRREVRQRHTYRLAKVCAVVARHIVGEGAVGEAAGEADEFTPLQRVVLSANGNLQRLISSYHNSPVSVRVRFNRRLSHGLYAREVTISAPKTSAAPETSVSVWLCLSALAALYRACAVASSPRRLAS